MYIVKSSDDEDGSNNWTTSLTLVDYPPSFGADEDKNKSTSKSTKKKTTKKSSSKSKTKSSG